MEDSRIRKKQGGNYVEIIHDPNKTIELFAGLIQSSTKEIMLLIPSSHICKLLIEKTQLLDDNLTNRSGTHIKILTPINESLQESIRPIIRRFDKHIHIRNIRSMASLQKGQDRSLDVNSSHTNYWDIKSAIILISDRTHSLTIQIAEYGTQSSFCELFGTAVYSNRETNVITYISLFERLWQQVELYKRVIESENAGNEFISIAAHELRNFIQPIVGLAEVVRDKSINSEQKEMLNIITRNAEKLKCLSDLILDVSRSEKNILKLNLTEIEIVKLILDNIQEYQEYFISIGKRVSVEFENNLGAGIYTIYGDKVRLNEVLFNLISNAIKFTDSGTIKIYAIKDVNVDDQSLTISVKDNGKGIDPDIMNKLFTRFTTSGLHRDTGIGLYLSKKIIEAHGGTIWASNNVGERGATFSFCLPSFDASLCDN